MNSSVLLIVAVLIYGCRSAPSDQKDAEPNTEAAVMTVEPTTTKIALSNEKEIPGLYVGDFENVEQNPTDKYIAANRITLIIEKFEHGTVKGVSVVAGNKRSFSGSYQLVDGSFRVRAEEPGDNRYDGVFTFTLGDGDYPLRGEWKANNADLKGQRKHYRLQKKIFRYDPTLALPDRVNGLYLHNGDIDEVDVGGGEFATEYVLIVNPSMQQLTGANIENMYKADLEILRNSIYARHGYSFKNKRIRYVFDHHVDWYIPVSTDVRATLTPLEVANIDLIKRYEEHADRYYDTFGR